MRFITKTNDPLILELVDVYNKAFAKWELTRALMPDAKFGSDEWNTFLDRLIATEKLLHQAEGNLCAAFVRGLELSNG